MEPVLAVIVACIAYVIIFVLVSWLKDLFTWREIEMNVKKESPRKVELVEVIHVVIARGKGTKDDPVHLVNQYWSKEGELLAEKE